MTKQTSEVKDIKMAGEGKKKIEWAGRGMPVLKLIETRFAKEKPLKGIRLGACLHVTAETANLMLVLKAGGAELFLCASNPLSTQDDVAASLAKDYGVATFAIKGEDSKTYYKHLNAVLDAKPQVTMDDGADLVTLLHKLKVKSQKLKVGNGNSYWIENKKGQEWEFFGSSEETTTGIIRLNAMMKDKVLQLPVFAVNDSDTKHMFDNRYGTGQSTLDGVLRATNMLLAGKVFVVVGYGWCGRGLASRARGMGARVVVIEVDPIKALEAVMEGYEVMRMKDAVQMGDVFVTVTGDKHVISLGHLLAMKDGAIVANSGHFNVEIALEELEKKAKGTREIRPFVTEYTLKGIGERGKGSPRREFTQKGKEEKKLFVLGEGRLINLAAAEGHPAEVMDMSFANQALAAEFFIKNKGKLRPKVYMISPRMDREIARLKLAAMGVKIEKLTREQKKYLTSWQEGT